MKLIVDTDMGIDDACALILALSHQNVEIIAITTVFGNVTLKQAVANACRIRKLVNRNEVPIYVGANKPLIIPTIDRPLPNHIHGSDGLGDSPKTYPAFDERDFEAGIPGKHAAQAILDLVHANPGCGIVCLGPLTNLALAAKLDPTLSDDLGHLYMMGGNVHAVGNVPMSYTAEFNFFMDPEAAHIVLSEFECPITALPWESHLSHPCSEEFVEKYANSQSSATGRFIHGILKNAMAARKKFEPYGLCDEMVVAIAIDPSIILASQKKHFATVELYGTHTRGQVALDYKNCSGREPNVEFVTKIDVARAEKMIMNILI